MTLPTQHIIRHLFRVETLEEVSRQQLEELVQEHPSFGVGRYLLSRKLQAESASQFGEETQKTNLYFTNPFWLQWLLHDQASSAIPPAAHIADNGHADNNEIPHVEEWNAAGEAELPAEEVFAPVTDTTEPVIETHVQHDVEPDEVGGPSAAELLLQSIADLKDQRQTQREEIEAAHEAATPPMGIAALALEQTEEEHAPTVMEPGIEAPLEMPAPEVEQPEEIFTPEAVTPEEIASPETTPAPTPETQAHEEQPAPEIQVPEEQPAPESMASEETPVAAHTAPPVEEPAPAAPVFEPFHTVDYFASQGIRLVLDENPSDRLGKQMKSFTEWLKVMRRLPQKNREIIPDIAAERQVQAIAAHSIEGREVVTEAMAEVLAKQGMREKAMEMYRKLSLLEPEKSAYFATRIEQLKII